MKINYRKVIDIIDFLSARFGIDEELYFNERDDIISETFEFITENGDIKCHVDIKKEKQQQKE